MLGWVVWTWFTPPALADRIDPYVSRYLKVTQPVPIKGDDGGAQQSFTALDLSAGKQLFENNCINCHVGGATLPNPRVSLSLADLRGASPPRDNINALVRFTRLPQNYDGTEDSYICRELSPQAATDQELAQLSAFILQAAKVAPGWGTKDF
ncbi:Cytochrome c-550-like protein [Gloeomargarita lithophora Alchichica-D10]|uniref:Cytochrome c-550-like protein n=1 Tax=Gloeomargarita lithophora Alchichica-D10 TaxID=1188229 RepID=A0A1J0AGR1_9CYAN|nr:photosystem II cytochrome PsbV2 [Gloeomargarita lithophora]APB35137.1 Cytochrome c-550-like protein [Gloeomargarita lithophora Alchichica-D10]